MAPVSDGTGVNRERKGQRPRERHVMLGRVLVMGCPWQPTRLMYAGMRSFRITLPVYARREIRTYSIYTYTYIYIHIYVTLPVGCTTTYYVRQRYNGKREVRFVCVHTRGRVN